MEFFERIDLWILDRVFQRIADEVADRFGISCFGLARLAIWGQLIVGMVRVIMTYHAFGLQEPAYWVDLVGYLMIVPVAFWLLWRMEHLDRNRSTTFMNPARLFYPSGMLRLTFILYLALFEVPRGIRGLLSGEWMTVMGASEGIFIVCFAYFMACRRRPPGILKQYVSARQGASA